MAIRGTAQGDITVAFKPKGDGTVTTALSRIKKGQKELADESKRTGQEIGAALGSVRRNYLAIAGGVTAAIASVKGLYDAFRSGSQAYDIQARFLNSVADAQEKFDALRSGVRDSVDATNVQKTLTVLKDAQLSIADINNLGAVAAARAIQTGEDTANVLMRLARAFQGREFGALKEVGIVAKDGAEAIRQLAEQAAEATQTLDDSFESATRKISTYWADMKSDMEVAWSQFIFGVVEGNDRLVSVLSRTYSDTIPKLKELQTLAEKVTVMESELMVQPDGRIGNAMVTPSRVVEYRLLLARYRALQAYLRSDEGRAGAFERGGAAAPGGPALGQFGNRDDIDSLVRSTGRGGGRARQGMGLGGEQMLPGQDFLDMLGTLGGGPTGNDRVNRPTTRGIAWNFQSAAEAQTAALKSLQESMREVMGLATDFAGSWDSMWSAIGNATSSKRALEVIRGFRTASLSIELAVAGVEGGLEFARGLAALSPLSPDFGFAWAHFAASAAFLAQAAGKGAAIAQLYGAGRGGGGGGGGVRGSSYQPPVDYTRDNRNRAPDITVNITGPSLDSPEFRRTVTQAVRVGQREGYSTDPRGMY